MQYVQQEIKFVEDLVKIFRGKMKEAKAKSGKWGAKQLLKEVVKEYNLTDVEKDIAWGILIIAVLGYDTNKIKELEDEWQKNRQRLISEGNTPIVNKPTKRPSTPLLESFEMDQTQSRFNSYLQKTRTI